MPIIKETIPLIDGFMELKLTGYVHGRHGRPDGQLLRTSAVVGHVVDFKCVTRSMTQYTIENPSEALKEALKIREKYNPKGLSRLDEIVQVTTAEMDLLAKCYQVANERNRRV